jgi:uridine kinase
VIIGVAGGSGSGKTTFARELLARISPARALILLQDSYYIDRSNEFKGDGSINFDHPDSIDWDLMAEHIKLLKSGETIALPIYDFATHSRRKEVTLVEAKPIIIVDGILIFYPDQIRELFDMSIYIDTPDTLCYERRLYRDTHERGRTAEGVRIQYETTVRPMRDQFVEPTKVLADQVISGQVNFGSEIDRVYKEIANFNSQQLV